MTIETKARDSMAEEFGGLTDAELVDKWEYNDNLVHSHSERRDRIGMVITRRLEAREARDMVGTGLTLTLKPAPPEYDRSQVLGLKELVTPAEWDAAFTPEGLPTEPDPWKLNLSKVNQWARAYGKPVVEFLKSVQLPAKAGKLVRKPVGGR